MLHASLPGGSSSSLRGRRGAMLQFFTASPLSKKSIGFALGFGTDSWFRFAQQDFTTPLLFQLVSTLGVGIFIVHIFSIEIEKNCSCCLTCFRPMLDDRMRKGVRVMKHSGMESRTPPC
jgi:hypothetical protein